MDFKLPSKYKYQEREEHWRKFWEENETYKFEEGSDKPVYSVDTPPPYVSAEHLHAGHIMSYSQAEFVVRFKRMRGFNVFYPMGFDDNGLPTERFVEKKYNVNKSKINRSDFIKLCLKETKRGAENYRDLWRSLGISVDWSKTYSTINPLCQRVSQWSFVQLYKSKGAYRKEEPTSWCPFCQTALAQADMEDEEKNTKLNHIQFLIDGKPYTIATTRPELLPACVGVFANPKDKRYQKLKGKKAIVPLFNYEAPVLFHESVDPEFGTGLMMVCTWGDTEDVEKFKALDLPAREVISKDGKITSLGGKYKGQSIPEARKSIIDDLNAEGLLKNQETITHIVNVHERCSTPVEFILTTQWFIKILDIKKQLFEMGEKLKWYPPHMKNIYNVWVAGLKWDWCISRQRYYGVPFPVWYCKKCKKPVLGEEKDLPIDPTEDKPPLSECPACGAKEFEPERDVMDTWATSSCTPFIIPELVDNKKTKEKTFPNSLRPQAFEIIRTWLFYSMVKSYYHFKKIPFRDAMISGHGLDETGRKISKRLGNYIEPNKLLRDYGADAIRYWATGAKLGYNHRFEIKEVKKGKHLVTKLWNASRFCSGYIDDFKPAPSKKYSLEPEDKWILHELNKTIKRVTTSFQGYEYAKARKSIDNLFWAMFCDYYLEMIKHRAKEESVKFTLYTCLLNMLKLYAPIIPFVTEEIYQKLFKDIEGDKSIHKSSWPSPTEQWKVSPKERQKMKYFIEEIDAIRKEKSEKGVHIKTPLKNYSPKTKVDLDVFGDKLREMLNIEFES
ncbi:MAG: valine--tRNA ligase [Candidatus Nealsonbacteria bacterium]|nr:valine--tRNA ligase [Candidatus Nealsonbacteria bacterium]